MAGVLTCGMECVLCMGCARWAWRSCTRSGAGDSAAWPQASPDDFAAVPRACRAALAAYEDDLARPRWAPAGGYRLDPASVARRAAYPDVGRLCPPYVLLANREAGELVLAVRGLHLARAADYQLLLDDPPGSHPFDGGFVHRGLLRAAVYILDREVDTIRRILGELGPEGRLMLAGHSLGAGVAALMALLIVSHADCFGVDRSRVRCYAMAPARCMSLDLAIKYADVINSVVLQDDFLPRTSTRLQHVFGFIFCLPCVLCWACMKDTFTPDDKKIRDPGRLYAPGRVYHIVERKFCRCGRFPPEVRTAIPVEGRFEHIVLSCNAVFDHGIIWIEREAQKALDIMEEKAKARTPPTQQMMVRNQRHEKEHEDALENMMSLSLLQSVAPAEESSSDIRPLTSVSCDGASSSDSTSSDRTTWDELVEKILDDESGDLLEENITSKSNQWLPLPQR